MVTWLVDPSKSLWENVQGLHERLKKLKKKRERLLKLIEEEKSRVVENEEEERKVEVKKKRKRAWYEAFRWMFTSKGKLVIGGRDARTNEIIVRRHLQPGDLFFHADVIGAPSVILKGGEEADEDEILEAATFAAAYSRAWKMGLHRVPVFYVRAEQVSLSPPSGEYRPRGGVIVKGKREWVEVNPVLYLGFDGERFFVSVKPREGVVFSLLPGKRPKEEVADEVVRRLGLPKEMKGDLVPLLPPGGIELRPLKGNASTS